MSEVAKRFLKYFKEFCERIGGRVVVKPDVVACVKETESVGELVDYVHDFHNFVGMYGHSMDRPVELVFESRLLGGWSEVASISYDPKEDKYAVYTRLYSEGEVEPEYVDEVRDELLKKAEELPHLGVTIEAEADVDQNPATDGFAGSAEAWASIPRERIRSKHAAPELAEIVEKAINLASDLAEEALSELVVSRETF